MNEQPRHTDSLNKLVDYMKVQEYTTKSNVLLQSNCQKYKTSHSKSCKNKSAKSWFKCDFPKGSPLSWSSICRKGTLLTTTNEREL